MNKKNILEKELNDGNLYNLVLSMDFSKVKELILKAETEEKKEFYNKLYDLILQTKQKDLIKKGVF